MLTIVKSP